MKEGPNVKAPEESLLAEGEPIGGIDGLAGLHCDELCPVSEGTYESLAPGREKAGLDSAQANKTDQAVFFTFGEPLEPFKSRKTMGGFGVVGTKVPKQGFPLTRHIRMSSALVVPAGSEPGHSVGTCRYNFPPPKLAFFGGLS